MDTNADLEARWIEAWNDLYDLARDRLNLRCLLPDGTIVGIEECKGWLQDSVYTGWRVTVADEWISGARGVMASRWREN